MEQDIEWAAQQAAKFLASLLQALQGNAEMAKIEWVAWATEMRKKHGST
jgi:hypothetical protein